MPRKRNYRSQTLRGDLIYNSIIVEKFVNNIMKNGHKVRALKMTYKIIDEVKIESFFEAIDRISPSFRTSKKKIASSVHAIPISITERKSRFMAIKWLLEASKKRKEKTFVEKIINEIKDILKGIGKSLEIKNDLYQLGQTNLAFTHYLVKNNNG